MAEYHWTPAAQRLFVETLSETGNVLDASVSVGMSSQSAYRLRHRAEGKLFRIGWDAATRLARTVVADRLLDRALDGEWTESVRDKQSGSIRRHARNYRHSLAMLARLDKMAEAKTEPNTIGMAVQIAEQDFGAFLDVMERADDAAAQAFFVTRKHWWDYGRCAPQEALFGAAWDADAEEWVEGEDAEPFMCNLPQISGENEGEAAGLDGPAHPVATMATQGEAKSHCPSRAREGNVNAVSQAGRNINTAPLPPAGGVGGGHSTTNHCHLPPAKATANHCNLPQNSATFRASATTALKPLSSRSTAS